MARHRRHDADYLRWRGHLSITRRRCASSLRCRRSSRRARGAGLPAIDPWRDQVQAAGLQATARQLKDAGIQLSGYCRGGFFTAVDAAGLRAALEDNRAAIDEAKTLGAPCVVLVVGSLPGALEGKPAHHDIGLARSQVDDGIAATLEYARGVGMPLAIEPLHPMQAAERACVNTLEQALDICDALDPAARARWVWPSTSTMCGGTRSSRRKSGAPAAIGYWPIMSAIGWCQRATSSTIAHDGRRRHRAEEGPRLGGGRGMQASPRWRFSPTNGGAGRREVLDTCAKRIGR